jgi:cell division protein FtsA
MEGIQDAAEKYLGMPVRRGTPKNIGGLMDVVNSPIYATGVGLVLYGAENHQPAAGRFVGRGIGNRIAKFFSDIL